MDGIACHAIDPLNSRAGDALLLLLQRPRVGYQPHADLEGLLLLQHGLLLRDGGQLQEPLFEQDGGQRLLLHLAVQVGIGVTRGVRRFVAGHEGAGTGDGGPDGVGGPARRGGGAGEAVAAAAAAATPEH